jgi:fimbrial chaperone protein
MGRTIQGALAGALFLFSAVGAADGIAVNPIRLELEPGQRTGSLNITNNSAETKVLQISVMQWKQAAGESVYEPASNVIATPVLFRMPPKSRQLVRVGFVNPPATLSDELSYRVYLTEVPEQKNEDNQVRFLLRLGIPMFFPPDKAEDRLDWQLIHLGNGGLKLVAENRGNRHVRLQGIKLVDNKSLLFEEQALTYLLPRSRKEWHLTPGHRLSTNKPVTLKAQSGRGMLEADIPVNHN